MRYDHIASWDIGYYTDRVLKDIGWKEPPICTQPVLEYFGIRLWRVGRGIMAELENRTGDHFDVPAALVERNDEAIILVNQDDPLERQRLSIFHECAHFDLPWHHGHSYFVCETEGRDDDMVSDLEREAYDYGGRVIFPEKLFRDDIMSMPVALSTITTLSGRYQASFEATALHYAKRHPGLCAILYLQLNSKANESGCPFLVRYSVSSRRFIYFWKKGTLINYDDLIAGCFRYRQELRGEITLPVSGRQLRKSFLCELRPYGSQQVCALVSVPDTQASFL